MRLVRSKTLHMTRHERHEVRHERHEVQHERHEMRHERHDLRHEGHERHEVRHRRHKRLKRHEQNRIVFTSFTKFYQIFISRMKLFKTWYMVLSLMFFEKRFCLYFFLICLHDLHIKKDELLDNRLENK